MIFSQLNISKMSVHSELSLQKFIHDQDIKLMALQETGCWKPTDGFFGDNVVMKKDTTSRNNPNLRGVALIVHKDLLPETVDIGGTDVDAIWCQIKLGRKRILVGSVYIYLPQPGVRHLKTSCYTLKKLNTTKKPIN